MGIALWLACAVAVFFAARYVPSGRPLRWVGELAAALLSALVLGGLATALDFGGWNEPDWRAALFVLFGSAAIVGCVRLIRMMGRRESGVGGRGSEHTRQPPCSYARPPTPDRHTKTMIRGTITVFLLTLNAAFWGTSIVLLGVVKFAIHVTAPRSRARTRVILMLAWLATRWVAGNDRIFDLMLPTQWEIEGIGDDVTLDGRYLIVSNHLSWVDIFALFRAFHGRAAFIRFFLKRQLFWSPVVGQACWALEFPFMHRYTPEYLEKHPEKRGSDLVTTRKACQRYRNFPVAILNFLEGTRFTKAKHDQQQSPYRHLLPPRIGGISFVLAALGDQLDAMYDVTLAYPPDNEITMGRFVCGRIPKVMIHARRLDPPRQFFDEAVTRPGPEREQVKVWMEEWWKEKDALLSELLGS